jgi:hypothetical protein
MNPHAFPAHPDGNSGMSLRDYFAAAALQGLCALNSGPDVDAASLAFDAYMVAEAMLKERQE